MASHFRYLVFATAAFSLAVAMTLWFQLIGALRDHEALSGHPHIQREFNIIQYRYECLQDYPNQAPEELALCDQQAREVFPLDKQ